MIPARPVLRVLDLFSGTGSITKAFRNSGHEVISLDADPRGAPSICVNILDWNFKTLPRGHFDLCWASCPCEQYSIARSNASTPRDLLNADSLVLRTQEIIDWFRPAQWYVENPSGSQLWLRFKWPRLVKTSYCAYGFPYRKHTTLATNTAIRLRPPCAGAGVCEQMLGTRHLEHAQKGGGGVDNTFHSRDELHRIPEGLCMDVVAFAASGGAAEIG
jgi:hypothetical protein